MPAKLPHARVLVAALLLLAATPPAWFVGAEILVVLGLAAWFSLAVGTARPVLASYWIGALHVGAFSWSLRHVSWFGWFAVAVLGGLYYAAAAMATQRAARGGRHCSAILTFAIVVAGSCWLRAEMPGIAYPHGQFAHAFWQWPALLAAVCCGGEPLQNALLAALGAATANVWGSWRTAVVPMRNALRSLLVVVFAWFLVTMLFVRLPRSESGPTVTVAAIETGLHPFDAFAEVTDRAGYLRRWQEIVEERLMGPTRQIAGRDAMDPPDLVLWPESSVPFPAVSVGGKVELQVLQGGYVQLAPQSRLLLGGEVQRDNGRLTPASLMLDAEGRLVGHHEKQRLVPAGETLPLGWLPASWAQAIREFAQTKVGIPDFEPGRALPPLRLAAGRGDRDGAPIAGLICYDNAFHQPVADAVALGARLICVLSNESWYRGGGELEQLAAISVLRSLACDVPIVRCTTDGMTMAVDRDGRVIAALADAHAPQAQARSLRVEVELGDGRLPPLAKWHPRAGWACSAWLVLAVGIALLGRGPRRLLASSADRDGSGS